MDKYSIETTGFGDNENHREYQRYEYKNLKIGRYRDRIEGKNGCGIQSSTPSGEVGKISRHMEQEAAENDREPEAENNAPSDEGQDDGGERRNDAIPKSDLIVAGALPFPPRRE